MKILVAPDKFKDALAADEVAAALASGARQQAPDADITLCPLGDGGDGTGRLLASVSDATEHTTEVLDPLGRPHTARWWSDAEGTAIIEMAEASGIALLAPHERDARHTSTYGTGQLLSAARDAGCQRVWLCVGGSATVDGGAGCLQALGWSLRDLSNEPLPTPLVGGLLGKVARLTPPTEPFPLPIDVLCDVENPLLGPRGAARVFGPQKTPNAEAVTELDAHLQHWAQVLRQATGRNVTIVPHGGAAGGLPAGLLATCAAELLPGFDHVAQQVQLDEHLRHCDLCLTGEGRVDSQTVGGKVVGMLAARAARHACRTVAFVGAAELEAGTTLDDLARELSLEHILVITAPDTPLDQALAQTRDNLVRAARDLVHAYT